jgi:hypothetical protein
MLPIIVLFESHFDPTARDVAYELFTGLRGEGYTTLAMEIPPTQTKAQCVQNHGEHLRKTYTEATSRMGIWQSRRGCRGSQNPFLRLFRYTITYFMLELHGNYTRPDSTSHASDEPFFVLYRGQTPNF